MPVWENYKCEKCDYKEEIYAESGDKLPKYKKCPECGGKCYRQWGASIILTDDFRATKKEAKGANWAKQKMKHYSGLRDSNSVSKRFY